MDHVKIAAKIGLIVAMFALVAIGALGFAVLRMGMIDSAYAALIANVDDPAVRMARAYSNAQAYASAAYQLVVETSETGNAQLLTEAQEARTTVERYLAEARAGLARSGHAEFKARSDEAASQYRMVFAACDPILHAAARVMTVEDNARIAQRLNADCRPLVVAAPRFNRRLVTDLITFVNEGSAALGVTTAGSIRLMVALTGAGVAGTIPLALWVGLRRISAPLLRLTRVMDAFARGDLNQEVPGLGRRDELGQMARTVDVFKTHAREVVRRRGGRIWRARRTGSRRQWGRWCGMYRLRLVRCTEPPARCRRWRARPINGPRQWRRRRRRRVPACKRWPARRRS